MAGQTPLSGPDGGPAASHTTGLTANRLAVIAGPVAPLALAAILVPFRSGLPNTDAALVMLLLVVAVAALGYRPAGYLAAASAAAWYDFFLTRPYETFDITRAIDVETVVLLVLIGFAVTEIAVWGRRGHFAASRRAGYLAGINNTARAVAEGESPSGVVEEISAR